MFIGLTNVQDMLADPKTWQSMWEHDSLRVRQRRCNWHWPLAAGAAQPALARAQLLPNRALPAGHRAHRRQRVYWRRAYHPDFGIISEMIGWFGIPLQQWLFEPVLAKPTFIFMRIWVMGTQMVIFLAGLQSVPQSLLEAAALDGANAWRKFWNVTVPIMTRSSSSTSSSASSATQVFAPALIMTKGGPQDATLFMVLYIYRNAFEYSKLGYAAALSWLFLFIILLTIIQFRGSGRWVFYESD